jgi:phosphoenolpyruvate carboxylase
MYGTKAHFKHNCEQLLTAGLSTRLFEKENTISRQDRQIIEKLAQLSFEKYTALKNHNMFIPYLENKSTLKYYGQTNIGSRPYKRGDKEKLDFDDLQGDPFRGVVEPIEAECSRVLRYRNGHPIPGRRGKNRSIETIV